MNRHPQRADEQQPPLFVDAVQADLHADGGDEDVDERGAEFGCASVVEFARRGEGEDESGKRYQQHLPEEGAV